MFGSVYTRVYGVVSQDTVFTFPQLNSFCNYSVVKITADSPDRHSKNYSPQTVPPVLPPVQITTVPVDSGLQTSIVLEETWMCK